MHQRLLNSTRFLIQNDCFETGGDLSEVLCPQASTIHRVVSIPKTDRSGHEPKKDLKQSCLFCIESFKTCFGYPLMNESPLSFSKYGRKNPNLKRLHRVGSWMEHGLTRPRGTQILKVIARTRLILPNIGNPIFWSPDCENTTLTAAIICQVEPQGVNEWQEPNVNRRAFTKLLVESILKTRSRHGKSPYVLEDNSNTSQHHHVDNGNQQTTRSSLLLSWRGKKHRNRSISWY